MLSFATDRMHDISHALPGYPPVYLHALLWYTFLYEPQHVCCHTHCMAPLLLNVIRVFGVSVLLQTLQHKRDLLLSKKPLQGEDPGPIISEEVQTPTRCHMRASVYS